MAPRAITDSATSISAAGTVDRLQMHGDAGHHRHDESDREQRAGAMRGGKAADRHHRGEMVDADHRMAEAGQQALGERRRHAAAHQVMGEGRLGGEENNGRQCGDFRDLHSSPHVTPRA